MIGFSQLADYADVSYAVLDDDGTFPNNHRLAVILYRSVVGRRGSRAGDCPPEDVEALFYRYGWGSSWRNGIYSVHHYHSTAHEVLGIYRGEVRILLGGEKGVVVDLLAGDVVVIPAGVAHKNISSRGAFRTVGAYPIGQTWDVCYGKAGERPEAHRNIESTTLPAMDPVHGDGGPTNLLWR